jgi:hypothetical protein
VLDNVTELLQATGAAEFAAAAGLEPGRQCARDQAVDWGEVLASFGAPGPTDRSARIVDDQRVAPVAGLNSSQPAAAAFADGPVLRGPLRNCAAPNKNKNWKKCKKKEGWRRP